ncbi:unnamed protein product [Clavelina lepadiformis]|uniref:G-protein coupled receptors family 1 profile domain-containing protein n=1 Tax=Clavelina lepadiformis TaxID=159417 RepID=A0ABP0GYL2_CLALP
MARNYTWQHLLAAQSIWNNIVYASFFHPSSLNTAYQIYYTVIGCITFTSWAVSCMTLMLASADRFLAIAYPKFYLKKRGCGNTLFTIAAIICCWGVGTVIGCIPLIRDDTEFEGWTIILFVSGAEGLIIVAVLIAIPLVGMWLFNILTFVSAKRQLSTTQQINVHLELNSVGDAGDTVLQTMIDDNEEPNGEVKGSSASNDVSHTDGESPDGSLKTVHEQQRRLAVTLAIVVGTFTLAFLPVCIALSVSGGTYYEEHNNLIIWLSVLCISNSFWNCIIYSVRQKEFRKDAAAIYLSREAPSRRNLRKDKHFGERFE